ncbi:uncharacterized protein IL334_007537 [Kwoniella shivajii]|uniref:Erythromycin biosynthesis protein CIII-like C-terminal domain-containing protein n=1 Tax=Kwoniella shivajii TaxID=564305 RepID=A0ABZ1D8Y0_9TREE|nr:hypothetical protein IL334_007537 [Kwoniella shivajii]
MSKPRLLFLTSPEAGQANVHLGVISSLKAKYGDQVDIYLGSFEALRKRTPENVIFLPVKGKGMIEHLLERIDNENGSMSDLLFKPGGFIGSIKTAMSFMTILHSESPIEYVNHAQDVERLIENLDPDFIVVDNLFECARDAILKLGRKCLYLSPNTIKEVAAAQQGLGVFSWPSAGTGYSFPLPWYLYPANIIITIFSVIWLLRFDKRHIEFNKARNAAGYQGRLPIFQSKASLNSTFLCVSTVTSSQNDKTEIQGKIPDWLVCCGPILLPAPSLEEIDLDLYKWVMKRPTVLIVLGTHYKMSEKSAFNMLYSIRILLEKRQDIQVLWKLQKQSEFTINSHESENDRIKIVEWLKPDPLSVLKTGNVICFVNHGGSNSYHEGLAVGVPQILLPAWVDCYDFAGRLSYIGNGVWGNRSAAPEVSEAEFTRALFDVVGKSAKDPRAIKMQARAKALRDIVTENGTREGSVVAADRIWEELTFEMAWRK